MKKFWNGLKKFLKESSEILGTLLLIIAIWYLIPPVLKLVDPQAGQFGIEILYIPLIAVIYCLIGLLFIWYALRVNFPAARRLLDGLFDEKDLTLWQKSQLLLRLVQCLVALYVVSLLAVTGISYIM